MYLNSMKNILALALLALMGCAASKQQTQTVDDPRCRELMEKTPDFVREILKTPEPAETLKGEKCPCVETISCGEAKYCLFVKCPDETEPLSTLKTDEAVLLPDH